jgi:hypothetical protein
MGATTKVLCLVPADGKPQFYLMPTTQVSSGDGVRLVPPPDDCTWYFGPRLGEQGEGEPSHLCAPVVVAIAPTKEAAMAAAIALLESRPMDSRACVCDLAYEVIGNEDGHLGRILFWDAAPYCVCGRYPLPAEEARSVPPSGAACTVHRSAAALAAMAFAQAAGSR